MSGIALICVFVIAIIVMIWLIAKVKVHPFSRFDVHFSCSRLLLQVFH